MERKRKGAESSGTITKRVKTSDSIHTGFRRTCCSFFDFSFPITKDLQDEYENRSVNQIQFNCANDEKIRVR